MLIASRTIPAQFGVGVSRPPSLRISVAAYALLALLFAFTTLTPAVLYAAENDNPAELLRLLEEGDFDARKAVEKRLETLGELARPALEKAVQNPSPELRQTAARLLERLSQASLTLEVFDRDGKPIPNADLDATLSDGEAAVPFEENQPPVQAPAKLSTDGGGRVQFPAKAPGNYQLALNFKDYSYVPYAVKGPGMSILMQSGNNRLRAVLAPRATVSGVIQREDGTPLGEAIITFMQAGQALETDVDLNSVYIAGQDRANGISATTDKDGHFQTEMIEPGAYHILVQHPDYETTPLASVQLAPGAKDALAAVRLTRHVSPSGTVRIRLLDDKGEPLANHPVSALLHLHRTPAEIEKALRTLEALHRQFRFGETTDLPAIAVETNEQGYAELKDIPAGEYDAVLTDEDHERVFFAPGVKAENAPPDRPGIKPANLGSIDGKITDKNGAAIAGRNVCALEESQPLTQLLLRKPDQLTTVASSIDEFSHTTTTDEEGKYSVASLPPGKYTLVVLSESQPVALVPHIEVGIGLKVETPALILEASGHETFVAQGKVLLQDRTPAAGAMVYLVDRHGSSTAVNTSPDGSFNTSWNAQPPIWLGVVAPGHAPLTQEFHTNAAPMEVVLQKEVPGVLRVTVTNADGRPVPGANVQVLPAAQNFTSPEPALRPANAAGQILLRNLRPGKFRVRVWNAARTGLAFGEVDVTPGQEAHCDLKLSPPARIAGRVTLEGAKADAHLFEHVQISLQRTTQEGGADEAFSIGAVLLTPDAEGRFAGNALPAGRYEIEAFGAGYVFAGTKQSVTLEAGATRELDVKLAPSCSIRVNAGAREALSAVSAGIPGSARPVPPGPAGKHADTDNYEPGADDKIGFDGTALLEGLPPGTYDVALKHSDAGDTQSGRVAEVIRVVKNVRVGPENAQKPLELRLPELQATAAIIGSLELAPQLLATVGDGSADYSMVTLKIVFVGQDQIATFSTVLTESLNRGKLQIIAPHPATPAQTGDGFMLPGLSAGVYTCETWLEWMNQDGNTWHTTSEKILLGGLEPTVTLAAGQTLDLHPLLIEIPGTLADRLSKESQRRTEQTMKQNLMYATQMQPIEAFQP